MGTERTLPAVILKKTKKIGDDAGNLGYQAPALVTYQANRVIRQARVMLFNREGQDSIKIAVEVLDGQTFFLFRLATLRNPGEPPTYVDLQQQTGSAAAAQIAQIERLFPHRAGFHWTVFLGEYPDSNRRFFRTRIELLQMPRPSETLRFLVAHRPNTWDRHILLESDPFVPHP